MLARRLTAILFACVFTLLHALPSFAAQGTGCMPTTGIVSGLAFAQAVNAGLAALISSNSGASPPATDCSGVAVVGQIWVDTSTTPRVLKQYDGNNWLVIGVLDSTNHIWTPPVGGGIATLSSASTVDLGSVPQAYVSVTGSTGPITSFGSSAVAGTLKVITFASTPTVTYNSSTMILPGAADLTAAAGDVWVVAYLGSGNWRVVSVQQASGQSVVNTAIPVGASISYTGFTPPSKFVLGYGQALTRSSYPDYLAAVTLTQTAQRTSGSAVLSSVADTSQLGPGMPIEGTGIPAGATIGSVTSTTITMASTCGGGSSACNASSSGTNNVVVFAHGYGAGGNTTTVGVMDCRGRAIVGRDNMGGAAASRITTGGSGINAAQLGVGGGAQSGTIAQGELPNVTLSVSGTASVTVSSTVGDILRNPGAGQTGIGPGTGGGLGTGQPGGYSISSNGGGTISGTTAALGSGNAHIHMDPVIVANCIVRVQP